MALTTGSRLGPYEIVAPIGAGGMGEVYKGRDTRLDRTVAIKVLPAHVGSNPEFRSRFEREARAISSLDHPNICALYDVGRQPATGAGGEAIDFLVMQHLDGETLAARLSRGPLPIAEALRYAIEIAGALDTAHSAGILHRDLKPGNVMLTKSGPGRQGILQAKLLDFGLAKLAVADPRREPAVQQTASSPLTGQGSILGTLQYMSPEQLEGRDLDARSDIFAFGAMLYEMVTATRPFEGSSQASVIAAILDRDPPPMTERVPLTPPALDRVVRKCLAKDPDHRWQTARDLGDELSWIAQGSGADLSTTVRATPPPMSRRGITAASIALAAAALGIYLGWSALKKPAGAPPAMRHLTLTPPEGVRFAAGGLAVSPDSQWIAYVAAPVNAPRPDGKISAAEPRIYLRRFDSDATTAIAGTEGAKAPFFSPDSLWIGYFTTTAMLKVSVLGGAPIKMMNVPPVTRGGAWGEGDTIVLTPTQSAPLLRVKATELTPLRIPDSEGSAQLWPAFLPGGIDVLITRRRSTGRNVEDGDIVVQNLQSGEQKMLVSGGSYARYSSTGHLLFVRSRTLMAVPFDVRTKEVKGTPLPIADGISSDPYTGGSHYAVAPDGTLLYMRGDFASMRFETAWVDRTGRPLPVTTTMAADLSHPRLSPDGSRMLLSALSQAGDGDVHLADVGRSSLVRLTTDQDDDFNAIWTLDGKRVIYTAFKVGTMPTLVWRSADGSGAVEPLIVPAEREPQFAGSVSPKGVVAYATFKDATRTDIHTAPLSGERKGRPFIQTTADEFGGEFSPDGRWLAYVSNESGTNEVYVSAYPGQGSKSLVSRGGGVAPAWCRTCGELYYQSDAGMMAVTVPAEAAAAFGEPRLLFSGDYSRRSREDGHRDYDVTSDGKRFVMLRQREILSKAATLEVVINWVERLNSPASGR
jgi:serine/threonine protein kinase